MRMLCLYDRDAGEALLTVADATDVPSWVDRAPLRAILTWWTSDLGAAFLHASAVGDEGGAVVFAGASGTGKSTTAMACLADGMGFIGDDACVVRLDDEPMVFTVYGRAKLERDALARLPALGDLALDLTADPVVLDATPHVVHRAPLRSVLLPCLAGAERSRLTRVSPTDARRLLVHGSLLEGGGAGGAALGAITRLAARVPCYRLDLGPDLPEVVATVRGVLETS
jgi:hypothetical protein